MPRPPAPGGGVYNDGGGAVRREEGGGATALGASQYADAGVTRRAIRKFENFHGMSHGTATLEQVVASSAGVSGWAGVGTLPSPGLLKTTLGEDSLGKGLGVVFKDRAGTDTWPRVRRIDPGSLVGGATPGLRVGCKLMSINGESTDGLTFKDAAPMTKVRPLEFVWQDLLIEAEFTAARRTGSSVLCLEITGRM